MTAADILEHWWPIAASFGYKTDAWLRLIRIAASGDRGCKMAELFPRTNGWKQLEYWRNNGIIEVRDVRDTLNRRRARIHITQKGLDLLRLERS